MYEPFNKQTASIRDKAAWTLCQIIDDNAPMMWTRHRFFVECIVNNKELMGHLTELAEQIYILDKLKANGIDINELEER